MATQSSQGVSEYRVKLGSVTDKKWHVMRFKPPHKCDLEKLVNPTLDRKAVKKDEIPEEGEGSEFGKKRREEVRKRKRGYELRHANPDDQPWILKEKKRGGKHFVGRKEGTVNTSSSYYVLTVSEDKAFEAYPIHSWYDFIPPVKYNYLNEEEAEVQFEKRNKTLNYFSVMVSKRLKDQEGEGEEKAGEGGKRFKRKGKALDELMLTDSESAPSSDASDTEVTSRKKLRKKSVSKKRGVSEGGEETDEGDMESWEVDYMSDSSSASEKGYKAKEAAQEVPKDDEEVERQEEVGIDKGFSESSSEDELTEEGKEISALIKKQSGQTESEGEDEIDVGKPSPSKESESSKKKSSQGESSTRQAGVKREREKPTEGVVDVSSPPAQPPPHKKQRKEYSTGTITEDEVKHYLLRKPITSKELVRKFAKKKTGMDKASIVEQLHQIIQGLKNVEKQTIQERLYLSLKPSSS